MKPLINLKNWFFDAFFPPTCLNCKTIINKKDNGLCAACFSAIPLNKTLFCGICRARLPNNKKICHKNAPYVLAAACDYQNEIVRKLIWQLKYRGQKTVIVPLAKIVRDYLKENGILGPKKTFDILMPVPLHPIKERWRGFNQSYLLAKQLIADLPLYLSSDNLMRVRNTPAQQEIADYQQRKINIEKAFALKFPNLVKDKNILLLDDVCTSGSTLTEVAKTLKTAGAKRVIALVVAKA